jgi:TolB-like protein/Tfp pilus assembly protein PilF
VNARPEEPTSALSGFFCELRRRKVYRVATGYAVVGWLLIQIAATTFPALELPHWSLRFVIIGVLLGFPIALVLGWAFDVGPHGFERTAPAIPDKDCPPALRPKRRNVYALAAVGLVLAAIVGALILPRTSWRGLDKSIAVLPFDNFSEDKENEHFADGIQDDLLTSLAKIGDLKVISRTSVTPYKGKAHNMKEIGRALGVGAILEGSVRREGNRVRLNVQLIEAATDHHLWAEIYERDLTDVFALQSALSQEIASQLKAKLSPGEKERIDAKPTQNSEAYLLSVQAHELFNRPDRRHDDVAAAEALYERALQIDASFALAQARLAQLESWFYYAIEAAPQRAQKARAAASDARRLQPDLAETHLALGLVAYYIERDYERALQELGAARAGLPNDATVYRAIAAIQRRQGKWEESTESYKKAASVDPKDSILLENLGWNYLSTRNYPAAAQTFDRAVAVAPDTFTVRELRARVEFYAKGDLRPLEQLLASLPENVDPNGTITLARFNLLMRQRKFAEAIAMLKRSPAERSRGETSAPISKDFLLATVYRQMNDEPNARAHYEQALAQAEAAVRENPGDAPRHVLLGLICAGLGRCEEALQLGDRAIELLPDRRDAFDGPLLAVSRARIHCMCGDHETALAALERSLQTPAGITLAELRTDPVWDALRGEPRFQKLIAP